MTSIIKMQAFSGVEGESPPCYMLQVDEFRFLLDCGWDENFDMNYLENLKKHIHQIDAVLLSYPDPLHLGALPYLVGKLGLNCPVYATIPVYKMGQMFMYDLYQSRHNTEDFDKFTLDDVDAAFDKILQLKYSQTVGLKGKGHGLQITPLPAGHMVGGTMWKIVKDGEEEIVYCIDYNHKKERHLNGCVLDGIGRPHFLITDAFNADYVQDRRRLRDEQLMTTILRSMRNDGNVLVTVDTAGRVLELAQLLDQMWRSQESGLAAYSLALLNNVSYNVVEFAKSQMEWMSDKIMRAFEGQRSNPFQFKHLQLCHSLAELMKVPDPKVVLASVPDMQCGFSRDLFVQWCSDPKNCLILTNRTSPGTLARWLIDNPGQKTVTLDVRRRVRLEGTELEQYLKKQKEKEADAARKKAEIAKKEREELESSDESEEEEDLELGERRVSGRGERAERSKEGSVGGATDKVTKAKHDLMMKSEGKSRTGFFKQAKKSYPMFPCKEERIKWDDYGEVIRPDDFIMLDTAPAEEEKMDTGGGDDAGFHDMSEVPTKCITTSETLDINAQILYIDFEGRSDGESIRKILQQIKPRTLVLVRGNTSATESLADYCRKNKDITNKIYVPHINEVLDATKESAIFQVKLKDSVVSALQFSNTKETDIAWIDAILDVTQAKTDTSVMFETEEGDPKDKRRFGDVEMREDGEDTDLVPTLIPFPPNQVLGHVAVFINEPKLIDFKQTLMKEGIMAEFSAGVLICNNMVAVRRNEAGRLELEGCLCDDYYRVRELLYDQFAIV